MKANSEYITQLFHDFEDRLIPINGGVVEIEFTVECYSENTLLYRFEYPQRSLVIFPEDSRRSDLIETIDRSGLFVINVEFNPSSKSNLKIQSNRIVIDYCLSTIPVHHQTDKDQFALWFTQACHLLGDYVYLYSLILTSYDDNIIQII